MEWLSHHPHVELAARVGYVFGQDPVALLRDDSGEIAWLVRAAAMEVYVRDEKARAKSSGGTGTPRRRR